jgi:hypothetical protein
VNTHREDPPTIALSGNVLHLGEHHCVVFHVRGQLPWVAEFRDGGVALIDAATWWRQVPGALASHRGRAAALAGMTPLTPELQRRLEVLHRRNEAARATRTEGDTWTALKRWCKAVARLVRGPHPRRLYRFPTRG